MDSFFDYFLPHVSERMAWDKLSREDQLAQLPTLSDDTFYHEYQIACEEIGDDGHNLEANANKVFGNKDISLEEIKADWQQFTEHVETLQAFHAEFLRRYFERRQNEHS